MDNSTIRESVELSISSFRDLSEPKSSYAEYILRRNTIKNEPSEITAFWKIRLKLVKLLQSGLNYDAVSVLELIGQRKGLLLAELVILYGRVRRIGDPLIVQLLRHEEALRLLVHDLKDFQGAETYCYSGGTFVDTTKPQEARAALHRELFPRLLGEYLRLESMGDRITQTVNLLDRWGQFFDVRMVFTIFKRC
jgi:vacuolar protein sorting-associated protein 3